MSPSEPNPLDIAIVGYSGRFPGASNTLEFWRNLCAGVESVRALSDDELLAAGTPLKLIRNPNYVKAEPQLSGYDCFDAAFFGYGPREAIIMDPQQRIFLECCWEALEDAGYDAERLEALVGVFAGAGASNYPFEYLYPYREQLGPADPFELGVGNALSSLPARVSHKLNLSGPSIAVQTACSTSLVAVHLAVQSLLSEECDMALAGAVFLKFPANTGYLYRVDGILSPDGHCRPFDHRAQGTIFGSGVGVVVLKRLRDALSDGDSIRALIKGTAVNNDGAMKAGFTAPNQQAQSEVIAEALAAAGVDAASISYLEAHGTGTALGDPVEIAALREAFGEGAGRGSCAIGSVKSNIGHLDAAAGMAGLLKTVLCLEHRMLPPSINFEHPNPNIDFDESPFFVNTSLREWAAGNTPRRAGVSSFGLGGTNSHVILEEAPAQPSHKEPRAWSLIPLSAKNQAALAVAAKQLSLYLDENSRPHLLADVAYTHQVGRRQWGYRRFVTSRNATDASRELRALEINPAIQERSAPSKVAFMLPGSADCLELASVMLDEEPVFREHVTECLRAWEKRFGVKCPVDFSAGEARAEIASSQKKSAIALFIFEYALAKTLIEWGVVPKLIVGRGTGEIAAACLRGLVGLEESFVRLLEREQAREFNGHVAPAAPGLINAMATVREGEVVSPRHHERFELASPNGSREAAGFNGQKQTEMTRVVASGNGRSKTEEPGIEKGEVDLWLEIGSSTALTGEPTGHAEAISLTSSDIERGHIHYVLGKLWERGAKVDWSSYSSRHRRRRVSAPTYPFERTRHWVDQRLKPSIHKNAPETADVVSHSPQSHEGEPGTVEEQVKGLFESLLAVADVGLDESFMELGGDSLLATQLASRLRDAFGLVIPLREILGSPTVHGVTALIKEAQQRALPEGNPIERVPRTSSMPLSFSQQRLWFLDTLGPGNPAYNISSAVRLNGRLDPLALERSIEAAVQRHEALRTGFRLEEGRPAQFVEAYASARLSVFDLQDLNVRDQQRALHEMMREESRKGFQLGTPPLFRAALFRLAARESVLLFTIHHIVADGWSLGVLTREVAENYRLIRKGLPPVDDPLPIQYVDFAAWQAEQLRGENLERLSGYWRGKLAGELPPLELPTDHTRPPRLTNRGERQPVMVSAATLQALQELAQRQNVTLYMTLLAAFSVLLHRYTRQTDLVIGSPIANRNRSELENLVGCFVNVLAMRIDLSGNPGFDELLERVKEITLDAYANQDLPFERLVEEIRPARDLSRTPIFQALFVLQNTPTPEIELDDLLISPFDVDPETSVYDLTLSVKEARGALSGWLEYNADLFEPGTIRRMIGHFQTLLESAASDPRRPIGELEILTEDERRWLLKNLNETGAQEPPRLLHELIRQRVMESPDAVAVCHDEGAISYGELDRRANQLANYLRRLGAGPEVIIGLYMERSIEAIVGMLGILKAGAAYMPIDPGYPSSRLRLILKETEASVVVTLRGLAESLQSEGMRLLCLDSEWGEIEKQSETEPESGVVPENLAYVVYTSGSTGKPKGVMVPHTGLLNLIRAEACEFQVSPSDRVLLYTSLSFDASLFEICMALGHGAQLVITSPQELLPTRSFVPMLRRLGITNMAIFPSALALLEDDYVPALRTLIVGGESCPLAVAERWRRGRHMFNTYGTSETTIWATCGACSRSAHAVYIGRALRNVSLYVLDPFMNPVPAGVAGEIYIGGIGVARGYLEMSGLTAERFLPNPFSDEPGSRMYRTGDLGRVTMEGEIEFLGRIDLQIKVQGVRIELQDIEEAILTHPAVKHAVVKTSGEGANKLLVGYFVSSEPDGRDAADMREYLSRLLPQHMIPSIFMPLEKLPLLPNGKLDQRGLPPPDTRRLRAHYSPPETELKRRVASIVEETLGVERIGSHENLFALGAHSLLMVQLKSRLDSAFGCDLPVLDLFQNPTVSGIAELLNREPQQDAVVESSATRAQLRMQLRERRAGAAN